MAGYKCRVLLVLSMTALHGVLYPGFTQARQSTGEFTDSGGLEGVVKTIKDKEFGVLIDCIDIYKQPALKHPLLRDHIIQLKPSSLYPIERNETKSKEEPFYQSWWKNGQCPQGTIPVIRRNQQKLTSERALQVNVHRNRRHRHKFIFTSLPGLEVALMAVVDGNYVGAHGVINIWQPKVQPTEASSSQIQLIKENGRESIGAGWIVDSNTNFPKKTTLFSYWMASQQEGCFNLECSGFVQVDPKHILGYPIEPFSSYGRYQYRFELTIQKDKETNNWWLRLQNNDFGYWPAALFTSLNQTADIITWGGQVMSRVEPPGSQHTTTEMGSGHFPDKWFTYSSFIRTLAYCTTDTPLKVGDFVKYVTRPKCYDVNGGESEKFGAFFYFGGPGYSDKCRHNV